MNVKKPSNENLPAKEFPVLERLFMDPKQTADLLKSAVNEGLIDAKALEAALNPFIEQARKGSERKKQDMYDKWERETERLKTNLFTHLVNFNGEFKELKAIVEPFCNENNLSLEPRPGNAVAIDRKNRLKPDWISKDGEYALRVTPSSVTIYTNLQGRWMPFNQ